MPDILTYRRCGYPETCREPDSVHYGRPAERRLWGHHDIQCQRRNPNPGPHLDGYPLCSFIDGHEPPCDYRRHAADRLTGNVKQ